MRKATIEITPPPLHPRQREIAHHKARFRVLACGRRWGKTFLGSLLCIMTALDGGRAWWVAPTYPISNVGWRGIKGFALQIPGADINKSERLVTMPGGGTVQVKSAHNPDALRGEGLDKLVLDECAFMPEAAWVESLRPTLSDRQGRAVMISTPRGRDWFYKLWERGNDPAQGEWASWQLPTSDNPYIAPEEIDAARLGLPDSTFRQEYLAEFMAFEGLIYNEFSQDKHVFQFDGDLRRFARIVGGVDWGYANPGVLLVIGQDSDGRLWLLREEYRRQRRVAEWAQLAKQLQDTYNVEVWYCDPSEPDYIDEFEAAGCWGEGADNEVLPGIQAVKNRLVIQGDGKPRLLISHEARNIIAEFESYQWLEHRDGLRDKPKKTDDHALDALRYVCYALDRDFAPTWGQVTIAQQRTISRW